MPEELKPNPQDLKKPMFADKMEIFLFNKVKNLVSEARGYRKRIKFDDSVDRNENRYRAMRSIRGLDYKHLPKTRPWKGCSDVGIPIEAITIQSIVARADRVEWERLPLTHVTGVGPSDRQSAPKIEAFLDWQKVNKMKLRVPKMMATRRTCIDGSYFWKEVWEEDHVFVDEDVMALRDPDGGTLLKNENGDLVEWDPDETIPLNDNLRPYQVVPLTTAKKQIYYRGPKVYGRSVKQILWSEDETTPDIQQWEWIGDMYYRSIDWLNDHSAEKLKEGGFRNVDKLIEKMMNDKRAMPGDPSVFGYDSQDAYDIRRRDILTKKILIIEWYGKHVINGKNRDIVMAFAPDQQVFMGWEFDEFKQRTGRRRFTHRTIIPMDGKVIGMSVITFVKGLRDTIDVIFNQMMDRGSRNNNPPIVYVKGSGFNPNIHNFGYRFWPEKEKGSLRVMELPKTENVEFAKIELLIGLIQRLFGVTDTTAGIENPANRTFGGIQTLLAEGNVNIDMVISTLNESNIELDRSIIDLNAMHLGEDTEFPIIDSFAAVMEDPESPFVTITPEELRGNYNFMPSGASLTVNIRSAREEAAILYKTVMDSQQVNPFVQNLEVLQKVTEDYFKSFGKKDIKVPTAQEVAQKLQQQAQAQQQAQQQQVQAQQQGKIAEIQAKGTTSGRR